MARRERPPLKALGCVNCNGVYYFQNDLTEDEIGRIERTIHVTRDKIKVMTPDQRLATAANMAASVTNGYLKSRGYPYEAYIADGIPEAKDVFPFDQK